MEGAPAAWPLLGLILAGVLIFSLALAALVRLFSKHQMIGQTYWMVVAGVAGVLALSGAVVGWQNVAFLAICFAVAGLVMGVEYFTRVIAEQKAAQQAREETVK